MLNKLSEHKKIVITIVVVLLAIFGIGAVFFINSNSRKPDAGLEVIKDSDDITEDTVDVSGFWEGIVDDSMEAAKKNVSDDVAPDTVGASGSRNDGTEPAGQTENNNKDNSDNSDEDILKDDITWGEIY